MKSIERLLTHFSPLLIFSYITDSIGIWAQSTHGQPRMNPLRFALVAKEMVESGQWFFPELGGRVWSWTWTTSPPRPAAGSSH